MTNIASFPTAETIPSNDRKTTTHRVWKSAQLCVGFHKDSSGRQRKAPLLWSPKDGKVSLYSNPSQQESFVILKSSAGNSKEDVQIRLRPDVIDLSRGDQGAWTQVTVDEFAVSVEVAGIYIRIEHDGTIKREGASGITWLEADGGVLKQSETVEASISADGMELTRRTAGNLSVIAEQGVLSRQR
jgi:hypothetical protein